MSKKKTEDAPSKKDLPLSQLLLDATKDKYRLVNAALRWAHEVKQRDKEGTVQEIINKSLKEILVGDVDINEIEKLPPVPKAERSASEPPKPLIIEKIDEKESSGKSKNGSDE